MGFGEAGQTFAGAGGWAGRARVFDIKTQADATAVDMRASYARLNVAGGETLAEVMGPGLILSLVTADQALAAAQAAATLLPAGALFCDMNSVAPGTKAEAARAINAAGGRYVDVAVMAPVQPAALAAPLLLSGPDAQEAREALAALGFSSIRLVGQDVGKASSIKMIRSVMVKGMEALTAECVLAGARAGVVDEVLASLGADWPARADYNLDRMMVHGLRRAAEMEEVVRSLEDLGVPALMTRGTVVREREIGALGIRPIPEGLDAKLHALMTEGKAQRP
jgi:3-hydroxyisobutyrate dehydrogenase-like beta-hydroxyacid dehydrogenase